jgi:hypothetical protein
MSLCLLALSACASTTYADREEDQSTPNPFEQPFRDVSWLRENAPEVLIRAEEAPYAPPSDATCVALVGEIAALDAVLGPDLNAPEGDAKEPGAEASDYVSDAIRGMFGLPYRSIIRRISGAERRERLLREAIFAGMVRRAFLKGLAHTACAPIPVPAPAEQELPQTP